MKDGKEIYYNWIANGNESLTDARSLLWKISQIKDESISSYMYNTVDYSYDFDGTLKYIIYGDTKIDFKYIDNTINPQNRYITDFLVKNNKLLKKIIISTSGINFTGNPITNKTYTFNYSTENKLSSVAETIGTNTKYNNTNIIWGDKSSIQEVPVCDVTDIKLNNEGPETGSISFADLNGDGYADRIQFWTGNDGENGSISAYIFDPVSKSYQLKDTVRNNGTNPLAYKQKITTGDLNNDGKSEIIFAGFAGELKVYGYSADHLNLIQNLTLNYEYHNNYHKERNYDLMSVDINRDGYSDVVLIYDAYKGDKQYYAGYSIYLGNSGSNLLTLWDDYSEGNSKEVKTFSLGDFHAKGKFDIVGHWNTSQASSGHEYQKYKDNDFMSFYSSTIMFSQFNGARRLCADFNNDGLTDVLLQAGKEYGYRWWLDTNTNEYSNYPWFTEKTVNLNPAWNEPSYRFKSALYGQSLDSHEKCDYYTLDYNGDGLLDFVIGDDISKKYGEDLVADKYDYDYTKWSFYKNTGGEFEFEKEFVNKTPIAKLRGAVTDINGDGVSDLVLPRGDKFIAYTMPQANRCNLVTKVRNGMGLEDEFAYKNFKGFASSLGNGTGAVRDLKAPIMLVDKHAKATMKNEEYTYSAGETQYFYENPKIHIEGKGFLGFEKVTATNTANNIKTVSNYGYNSYFDVNLLNTSVTSVSGEAISSMEQISDICTNSIEKGKNILTGAEIIRYIPIVTGQTTTDAIKGLTSTSSANYTKYPGEIVQTNTIGDLTTTTTTTFTGPSGKTQYLPASVTTTREQGGQSYSRTKTYSYEYHPTYWYQITKLTETSDPNSDFQLITVNDTPDSFGHLTKSTVNTTRSSSVKYTPSGRFIQSKTNHLGETTTYDWNEKLGLLNSETNRIGTTKYKYNNWFQLEETTYPTGVRSTNVLQWTEEAGVKYYSYSETSGSAPVWIYFDDLGREIRKETLGLDNKKISIFTGYDYTTMKVSCVSEPTYKSVVEVSSISSAVNWTRYKYNKVSGAVDTILSPMGKTYTSISATARTITVTSPEGTKVTTLNTAGQVLSDNINGKEVTYTYWPSGLVKTSTPQNGRSVSMEYDLLGNRTKLDDPSAGITSSQYNAFGELMWENNAKGIKTENIYDTQGYGILMDIVRNGEKTTYTYDPLIKTRIKSITIPNKNTQTFTYDAFGRVTTVAEDITANYVTRSYVRKTEYDFFGRTAKEVYPSGYYVVNNYDNYSNLIEVKDNANRSIWKIGEENALGQTLKVFKGCKELRYKYDPTSHLTTDIYETTGIVDYTFKYDAKFNLEQKLDNITLQKETYQYDALNQLRKWSVYNNDVFQKADSITYHRNNVIKSKSDLKSKSDIGTVDLCYYGHRLDYITGTNNAVPFENLNVTYTNFNKIATLKQGIHHYSLTYGVDDQRRTATYRRNDVVVQTRYYLGDYEEEIDGAGNVRKIHYLSGAILISNKGKDSLLYTYSDNQGSLLAITRESGLVLGWYAYDPWGARRDADDWTKKATETNHLTNRGYTGHEHLDAFGIINMNGRVYDPLTAQFFSPDPYIQDPGNWLNYNRYSYCYNNPFKYTDPSGEFIITAIVAGAIINGIVQTVSGNVHSMGDLGKAALIGGLSGGAGAWAGSVVSGAISYGGFAGGATIGAASGAAGGFVGGAGNAWANGAGFGDGIMAGVKGAGIGVLTGGMMGGTAKGLDAVFNGKANFWDGHIDMNLSKGFAAHNLKSDVVNSKIKGFYRGKFEGVRVYESSKFGTFEQSKALGSGGITLPDFGIIVGDGVYSQNYDIPLLKHEFGHILQANEVGVPLYYHNIGMPSISSANNHGVGGWNHEEFWTETWANYKSNNYFKSNYGLSNWNTTRFPIQNISSEQYIKSFGMNLYLQNY